MSTQSSFQQKSGCLATILRFFGIRQGISRAVLQQEEFNTVEEKLPYRVRDDFLSPAEHSFYLLLKNLLAERLTICPKVSLADIFFVTRPNENISAYNRINRKHVDFLVCDPKTLKPVFGLELDDSSHFRLGRIERDDFVEKVFQAANLPLIRVPVQASYTRPELENALKGVITSQADQLTSAPQSIPASALASPALANEAPYCPKCGERMVLRTARSGKQAGQQFFGCPNYPKCRMILPVKKVGAD
jgi:predicted RNA-binding Zn-ribbon protein involved in translation (DUF1610 family)